VSLMRASVVKCVARPLRRGSQWKPASILPPPKDRQFLARGAKSFYKCSHAAVPEEKAAWPVRSNPFRLPPLATRRSGRAGDSRREDRIVGLLNCGASVAGIATREGLTAKRARRGKWRRNGLKSLNPRRGTVWLRTRRSPKI
jgi:hypothetical protein